MPELKKCLLKSSFNEAEQNYLLAAKDKLVEAGLSEQEAGIRAVQDLQEETLSAIEDVYAQIGLPGYRSLDEIASSNQNTNQNGNQEVSGQESRQENRATQEGGNETEVQQQGQNEESAGSRSRATGDDSRRSPDRRSDDSAQPNTRTGNIASGSNRSRDQFRNFVLDEILTVPQTSAYWRIAAAPFDQQSRLQAARDIREGNDTPAAKILSTAIDNFFDAGFVMFSRGTGSTLRTVEIPINEYIEQMSEATALTDEEITEANEELGQDFDEVSDSIIGAVEPDLASLPPTPPELQEAEQQAYRNSVRDEIMRHIELPFEQESNFNYRLDIETLDQGERLRAVRNIRQGKDTKAARNLMEFIDAAISSNDLPFVRGKGNHVSRIDVPLDEFMEGVPDPPLTDDQIIELNTLMGEEAFNELTDNILNFSDEDARIFNEAQSASTRETASGPQEAGASQEAAPTGEETRKTEREIRRDNLVSEFDELFGGALPSIAREDLETVPLETLPAQWQGFSDNNYFFDQARKHFANNDKMLDYIDWLQPLLATNPNIKIDPTIKLGNQYEGMYFPDGTIAVNFNSFASDGGLYRAIMHEFTHAVTQQELATNPAFASEITDMLSTARKHFGLPDNAAAIRTRLNTGKLSLKAHYGFVNEAEFVAEIFSNHAFREGMSKVPYKTSDIIKEFFQRLISALSPRVRRVRAARKLASTENVADYVMSLTKNVVASKKVKTLKEGQALPSINRNDKRIGEWVKQKLIEGVPAEDLKFVLQNKLNITEAEAQDILTKNVPSGIRHAATAVKRNVYGLGYYEKQPTSLSELREEARQAIKDGVDIEAILRKVETTKDGDMLEMAILTEYEDYLNGRIAKNPSDENISLAKRVIQATDNAGSEFGKKLRMRAGVVVRDESLAGFFTQELESARVEFLTDDQKATVMREYEEITKARDEYKAELDKLHAQFAEYKAKQAMRDAKNMVAEPPKKTRRKSHDEYARERENLLNKIQDKWKNAGKDNTLQISLPYAKQLIAIAPDVSRLAKSFLEEGVVKLADVISEVHKVIKQVIPEVTEDDIRDVIAGEYGLPKSKNQLQQRLEDLRVEARLLNKLAAMEAGKPQLTGKKAVKTNQEITELRLKVGQLSKRIKDEERAANKFYPEEFEMEPLPRDARKLEALAKKFEREAQKVRDDLNSGNYVQKPVRNPMLENQELKKLYPEQFERAMEARRQLAKVTTDRDVRIIQQEYEARTRWQKAGDKFWEIYNVPRTLMSSMDFSAVLRQGIIPTLAHPRMAARAFVDMFIHAFNGKKFDNWFHEIQSDPDYEIMTGSGLYITDPHDKRLKAKEEAFMNNLVEKVPFLGGDWKFKVGNTEVKGFGLVKASERAYVTYLNKMRVDMFRQGAALLVGRGKTLDNSEADYKALASWVNNATGRGKLHPTIERAAPLLNGIFFSPRLMASRMNLLNPFYYAQIAKKSPQVFEMMAWDMGKFLSFGYLVLAMARHGSPEDEEGEDLITVEENPRSSDFGKIKIGSMRYDIWGGFQQYVVAASRIFTGEKLTSKGDLQKLDGEGMFSETRGGIVSRFVRGKLAPVPAMIVDFGTGKTLLGERIVYEWPRNVEDKEISALKELGSHMFPLIGSDIIESWDKEGAKTFYTTWLPATFGISVQNYDPKK